MSEQSARAASGGAIRVAVRATLAGLVLWFGIGDIAWAQDDAAQIQPNYREADIRQVIEAVGEVTGRNFLVDPRVRGQITLLSFTPMTPDAFYQAFLATLEVNGFVALDSEGVIKIVPDANARQMSAPARSARATRWSPKSSCSKTSAPLSSCRSCGC